MKFNIFELISILLFASAFTAWLNAKFVRLPGGIGITVAALSSSLIAMGVGHLFPHAGDVAKKIVESFNFQETIFHGVLAFLLFAGALHIDIQRMARQKWSILLLSTLAVGISTFIFGCILHYISVWIGTPLTWGQALLFGAIISPTDPITALSMLKKADIDPRLEAKIAGESLFNDGAALVIFSAILPFAINQKAEIPDAWFFVWNMLEDICGGAAVGITLGAAVYFLIKHIDDYITEILLTISLAAASWAIAEHMGVSAPISTVCAGIFMVLGAPSSLSTNTKEHLFPFWGLIDNILNAILFTLVGLELMLIPIDWNATFIAMSAIPTALLARFISVWAPLASISKFVHIPKKAAAILTWGGLRGAISIAMALSLPKMGGRDVIIMATYWVVVFSIVIQGLSLPKFAEWAHDAKEED